MKTIPLKSATSSTFDVDALAMANKKLAVELASTKYCYNLEVSKLTDELTAKLSSYTECT